jgi:hypothetical protein
MGEDFESPPKSETEDQDWHQALETELYERLDGREIWQDKQKHNNPAHPMFGKDIDYQATFDVKFYKTLGKNPITLYGHPRNSGYEWEWKLEIYPPDDSAPLLDSYEIHLTDHGVDVLRLDPGERQDIADGAKAVPLSDEEGEAFLNTVRNMIPHVDAPELTPGSSSIPLPPAPRRDPSSGSIELPPAPQDRHS